MGGCFGNTPIDKYLEKQVEDYCSRTEEEEEDPLEKILDNIEEENDDYDDDDFVG